VAVRVVLSTGVGDEYAGGEKEFEFEAKNVRAVLKALDERFPGLGQFLEEQSSVAIDGQLHEAAYFQKLNDGAEVYFLPLIEAG
jgi:molybdopterin synthase sulfur carrier subunit